uniref:Uncharacterized protein n=1 Tax=Heterorhabditis bacteriophora TaxID=37862 RepID=A0A1I7XG23_HETBA
MLLSEVNMMCWDLLTVLTVNKGPRTPQ